MLFDRLSSAGVFGPGRFYKRRRITSKNRAHTAGSFYVRQWKGCTADYRYVNRYTNPYCSHEISFCKGIGHSIRQFIYSLTLPLIPFFPNPSRTMCV